MTQSPSETGVDRPASSGNYGQAIVTAFAAATAVAVVALVVSAPAIRVGAAVAGPVLLLVWLSVAAVGARRISRQRLRLSAIAGTGTAAILLIFLGSLLTEPVVADSTALAPDSGQPASEVARLKPEAPLFVAGFLALGAGIGLLGGVLGRFTPPAKATTWPWPARLALVATVTTLPLLLLGGLVTSTESGMAVPDWPGSYGLNMVLFPLGLMANPRIFLEHSHRLFGVLVGAITIAVALAAQISTPGRAAPKSARLAAWIAVVLVIVQGVLGGTRVTENSLPLATAHGILAQVFFTLLACVAAMLTPAWADRHDAGRVSRLTKIVLAMLLVQLMLGAMFRHSEGRSWHPLAAHVALSLGILIMAPILGAKLGKSARDGVEPPADRAGSRGAIRRIGKGLMHATGLQFLLGWGALAGAWMGKERGPIPLHTQLESATPVPLWETVLTTAHQANGAVLLLMAGLAVAWTWRRASRS